jgi:hypothetical protein
MSSLTIASHVQSVIDADGAVLLDLNRGKYFSLNGLAADIWGRIEAGRSVPQIEADLAAAYDAPAETLRGDLMAFVASLKQERLVHAR